MTRATNYVISTTAFVLMASIGVPASAAGTHQLVLYRPATSTFYIRQEEANAPVTQVPFGAPGDVPFFADFTGDGKREPALYRKGEWMISTHADGKVDITTTFGGQPGEIPLVADVDGDGKADFALFRSGAWYVRGSSKPAITLSFHFGIAGDKPLLADFDGDGKVDFAVYRAGHWYVDTNRDGKAKLDFVFGGEPADRALAVDWDGHAAPALFRAGVWLVSGQHDGKVSAQYGFGATGDIPLAAFIQK